MGSRKLQQQENTYLDDLNDRLSTVPEDGAWDWPAYELTFVSAVVLGWRHYQDPAGATWMEAVYSVTVGTKYAVPNAGQGKQDVNDDEVESRFTFVQPANSVAVAGGGYETQLLTTCVWKPLPKPTLAPPAEKALLVAGNALAADDDSDDPPGKPHPP